MPLDTTHDTLDAAKRSDPVPSLRDHPKRRVLVVEDEPLIAYDLITEIEAGGHDVIGHCRSASEAIVMVGAERPDVVVMDIGLIGKGSGLDAAREIRDLYGIGCVFVSATLEHVTSEDWEDIKPLALISKPHGDKALSDAIGEAKAA